MISAFLSAAVFATHSCVTTETTTDALSGSASTTPRPVTVIVREEDSVFFTSEHDSDENSTIAAMEILIKHFIYISPIIFVYRISMYMRFK